MAGWYFQKQVWATELSTWIHKRNKRLHAGYVHLHRPDTEHAQLCFCERIFYWPLEQKTLGELVRNVALYADGFEVLLGDGQDEE